MADDALKLSPTPATDLVGAPPADHPHSQSSQTAGVQIIGGTLQMLLAQALNVPLGILTNALLTRTLGPELFGLFVLVGSIGAWFEIIAVRTLGRTSVKLIANAEDWKHTASQFLQIQFLLSLAAALIIFLSAPWIAALLAAPVLAPYLRIAALEIPFAALVRVQESALIGRRRFGGRAAIMATHGVFRLALVFALLASGLSLIGALLAEIGAAAAQFLIARLLIPIPIRLHRSLPWQSLAAYGVPLFLYTIAIALYQNLDIVLVKALSVGSAVTGFYGAAESLMTMPGMISVAFSPLLLSVLTGLWQQGNREGAQGVIAQTIRLHLIMMPFIALAAGTSAEIIHFLYGSDFVPAAPIMAWLVFAGLASMLHSTMTASLTAIGEPALTFWITLPLLPLLVIVAIVINPMAGALGIAMGNTLLISASSITAISVLIHKTGARFPLISLIRMSVIAAGISWLGWISQSVWPATGLMLIAKLIAFCLLIALMLAASLEVKVSEMRFIAGMMLQTLSQISRLFRRPDPSQYSNERDHLDKTPR